MEEQLNIQWFPGHMTKARRMIGENLKLVDAICEILDARIPLSSRNPDLDALVGEKPRLVILNRADQADPAVTRLWTEEYARMGMPALLTDCKSGKGVNRFPVALRGLLREKIARYAEKGQTGRPLRAMIVGIPNVGKSSFINRIAGRKAAEASDRPGVTRGKQWIKIEQGLELLDTPGILWPRFESRAVGERLAFTGAVRDQILDREALAARLLECLRDAYPAAISERYKLEIKPEDTGRSLLETAARKRGFLLSGGVCDLERMAVILLDEFRGGKLGRISLERPEV